jgi:hypothetical protein
VYIQDKKKAGNMEDAKSAAKKRAAETIKDLQEKKSKLKQAAAEESREIDKAIADLQKENNI